MKPIAAEIQPAVDLAQLRHQWDLACGKEDRAERTLAETRLEKGRLLVQARKAFPARGPKARGWGELLAKWKLDQQTAWKYMQLAGYVDEQDDEPGQVSRLEREIPTYAEAGITKPRRAPVEAEDDEPTPLAIVPPSPVAWMQRIEQLAEDLQRHTKAMFSTAQELDALCSQHESSIASPSLMTARSMLAGVKASVADALQLMGGRNA